MILANTTDSSINANNSSTVELVNGNTERTTSENKSVDNLQKNATTIGTSIAEEQKSVEKKSAITEGGYLVLNILHTDGIDSGSSG